jgi:hypothetical protein
VRPALVYSAVVLIMVLIAGVTDLFLLNGFAASSINHIHQVLTEQPPYQTPRLIYLYVLLGLFLPPLSLFVFRLWAQRKAAVEHAVLWGSTLFFLVAHTLSPSRQERYLLPVLPELLLMTVIGLWYHYRADGFLFRHKLPGRTLLGVVIGVNGVLLVPFTLNYGHKGVVEPFVQIARYDANHPMVMLVSPASDGLYAWEYSGFGGLHREVIRAWPDLARFDTRPGLQDSVDFYLLYPPTIDSLRAYVDSIQSRVGPLHEVFHVTPSLIDKTLHRLNPKFNPNREVWAYRRARR